jgi:hypothetical protein
MQRTANFHYQIADARLPEAVGVVDDTTALDAAVDVLDTHTTAGDAPIGGFLRPCERPAPRLLRGHDDLDVAERGERVAGGSTRGDGFSGGTTRAVASASVTPIRWANACKDRLGASPSVRSVACSTTSRT